MKFITSILTGAFILLTACATIKENTQEALPLFGTKWSLEKIHTGAGVEDVQTKAFITFNQEKKSAGGNGSCNSFGSSVTFNNNGISFKDIFSTKMYCEGVQETENSFLRQLEIANRFEIKEKTLVLYQDKTAVLEFAAE